jgi:hypothetical protein
MDYTRSIGSSASIGQSKRTMKKTCVVCVATGIYTRGLNRLKKGLANVGFDGDLVTWEDSLPQGSPAHNESPMGFKPCAMKFAIEGGYRYVLWLDANCVPIRSLDRLFSKIHRDGFIYIHWDLCSVNGVRTWLSKPSGSKEKGHYQF